MSRTNFMESYSVLEVMKGLVSDWSRFRRLLARGLHFAFGLNWPPRLFLISHFSSFFTKLVWLFLQGFLRVLGLACLCECYRVN